MRPTIARRPSGRPLHRSEIRDEIGDDQHEAHARNDPRNKHDLMRNSGKVAEPNGGCEEANYKVYDYESRHSRFSQRLISDAVILTRIKSFRCACAVVERRRNASS
jgi:hypothetical protein